MNNVQCIGRTYRIIMPDGDFLDVEWCETLSQESTKNLLNKDDKVIFEFAKYGKFVEYGKSLEEEKKKENNGPNIIKKIEKIEKIEKIKKIKKFKKKQKSHPNEEREEKPIRNDRIKILLEMPGEFTRIDYQNRVKELLHHSITKWEAYGDIEEGVSLTGRRLEPVGVRRIPEFQKYKVVDIKKEKPPMSQTDRFFHMSQMKGEFTRIDYKKHIDSIAEEPIKDSLAFADMADAKEKGLIIEVGKRDRFRLFKVKKIQENKKEGKEENEVTIKDQRFRYS